MKIVFEIILRLSWLLNIQEKEEKLLSIFFFHPTDFHIITFLKSKRKELQLNCLMHIKKPIVSGGQKKSLFVVLQNYYDQLLPTFLFYYVLELYYITFQKCRKSCFCKIWWLRVLNFALSETLYVMQRRLIIYYFNFGIRAFSIIIQNMLHIYDICRY